MCVFVRERAVLSIAGDVCSAIFLRNSVLIDDYASVIKGFAIRLHFGDKFLRKYY